MKRIALGLALAAIVTAAGATEKTPVFPKRTDYSEARQSMIALGWEPAKVSSDPNRCSIGFEDRCQNWPEAEACSGTGRAMCKFLWRKQSTLIEVVTAGEEDPPIVVSTRCRTNCR